jgi:Cu/Ag efflux protein CusF
MITRTIVALAMCLAATTASAAKEFFASETESATATVKKVDQKTRQVTVTPKGGKDFTFTAGDEVKNLAQLKKGDVVDVMLNQTLALRVLGKDEAAPMTTSSAEVARAPAGAKPGGVLSAERSGVATVESIAPDKSSVTLKGPKGNLATLPVRDPANLEGVAVGTKVAFAYTATLAIAVEPAKAAPKAAPKAPAKK